MKLILENLFTEEQIHQAMCFGIQETHRLYNEDLHDIEDERIDKFIRSLKKQNLKLTFKDENIIVDEKMFYDFYRNVNKFYDKPRVSK